MIYDGQGRDSNRQIYQIKFDGKTVDYYGPDEECERAIANIKARFLDYQKKNWLLVSGSLITNYCRRASLKSRLQED